MSGESKFDRLDDEEEEEEGSSWQDSYSDLVTDLLAIFVILFSFAMINNAYVNQNTNQTTASQIELRMFEERSNEYKPFEQNAQNKANEQGEHNQLTYEERFNKFYEVIASYVKEQGLSEEINVTRQGNEMIMLRVFDSALFDSGKADITVEAEQLLNTISVLLSEHEDFIKMVRIEGHTDNVPMTNREFESNWELSTARAVNILKRVLDITGLEPMKFSAVGYAEYHPIADNGTSDGRALNRRVEFFIETVKE